MKTSKAFSGAVLALTLALPYSIAQAEPGAANLNLFAGQKQLDSDDWSPIDEQTSVGISIDYEPEGWWLGATVGVYNGTADESVTFADTTGGANPNPGELTSDTWELSIGPKKVFKIPGAPVRAYVGGGYSYMSVTYVEREFDTDTSTSYKRRASDSGHGVWASTGVFVTLAETINLGLEGRISRGEVDLNGFDAEAGGDYLGAIVGLHFQ
ncbi:hypothetical protein H0Z60_05165 [Ectothiorhodospiraceae bacterium WFHF3C12]|nr:hypothetical protein [Ectothiorhodospiraceae bacterium WFHF3C12]